jgi:hypothetical protein
MLYGLKTTFNEIGSGSCATITRSQLVPQVSSQAKFIAVSKLTVAFRRVQILNCLECHLGKMTSTSRPPLLFNNEASERDSDNFDKWIEESGDVEVPNPVDQPVTTNNTNNQAETAPTPNNVVIHIQPSAMTGITAANHQAENHPTTPSIFIRTPCPRSSTTSRQSSGSGSLRGKQKNSSNKEQGSVLETIDCIAASFENGVWMEALLLVSLQR